MLIERLVTLLAGVAVAHSATPNQTDITRNTFLNALLRPRYIENLQPSAKLSNPKNNSYGHGELLSSSAIQGEQQGTNRSKKITGSFKLVQADASLKARVKRYTIQGSRWKVKNLYFRISNYPQSLPQDVADRDIKRAFKVWSDVTPFKFYEASYGPAHIEIKFVTGAHGDHSAFDDSNPEIAHAFYPNNGGDIHLDDNQDWSSGTEEGINLFQVMTHEIGHSLGLEHTEVEEAVMYEGYPGYNPNFRLHQDDIDAIQSLYGNKVESNNFFETGDSFVADLCNDDRIDTIFYSPYKEIYVFKGKYYWKLSKKGSLISGPSLIRNKWPGLPSHIDAAFTNEVNEKTYFFKKNQFWRYDGFEMDNYYPRLIADGFHGIPNDLDATIYSRKSGSIFFFKGSKFWKFNPKSRPPVLRNYPQRISEVFGVPSYVDGVIKTSQTIYFFKNKHYYQFKASSYFMESPKPTYEWFGCKPQGFKVVPGFKRNDTVITQNISWKSGDEGYS